MSTEPSCVPSAVKKCVIVQHAAESLHPPYTGSIVTTPILLRRKQVQKANSPMFMQLASSRGRTDSGLCSQSVDCPAFHVHKWGEPHLIQQEQLVQGHGWVKTRCVLRKQGSWARLEHLWFVPGRCASWVALDWNQPAGLEKEVMLGKTHSFLVALDWFYILGIRNDRDTFVLFSRRKNKVLGSLFSLFLL